MSADQSEEVILAPKINAEILSNEVEAEISIVMKTFDKCDSVADMKAAVTGVLHQAIAESCKHQAFARHYLRELQKSIISQKTITKELNVALAKLELRPYIKFLERTILPAWLLNASYLSMRSKIIIALEFQLTKEAIVLAGRLANGNITIDQFADSLSSVCTSSSDSVQHNKDPGAVILTDEEWNIVYNDMKVVDATKQQSLKIAVKPITNADLTNIHSTIPTYSYLFYAKGLKIPLDQDGVGPTTTIIQKFCSNSSNHTKMKSFKYLTNPQGIYTGEVVFIYEYVFASDADKLKTDLLKNSNNGFVRCEELDVF